MATIANAEKAKYVYQLPFFERTELCKILNQNDKWEELAGKWMKYDVLTIQILRKEKNPTDELLTMWGHHNHTILELFVLLSRMRHYQSMIPLKAFVDEKFHRLLREDGSPFRRAVFDEKDLKIGTQNFNQSTLPCIANVPKVMIAKTTAREEESGKILNEQSSAAAAAVAPAPLLPVGGGPEIATPSNSNNLLVVTPAANNVAAELERASAALPNVGKKFDDLPEASLPHATFGELAVATNGWNKHNILGKGGFGTVYRGIWKNTDVAIKRIERRGTDSEESYSLQLRQSLGEIRILNSRAHENILPLYAYSLGGEAPCLVYQLMKNGSLEDKLLSRRKPQEPLSWIQRHEIAKGIARGLQYLHTIGKKPLIHGDIKSANILLDKNFEPKIGDFGLAREGPEKDSMKVSKIHGTRPYLPEEFLHGRRLSTKVDSYSYGIVLFELATGLSAYDDSRRENKFLKDYIDSLEDKDLPLLIDKRAGEQDKQVYGNLIVLGKWCANRLAQNRPEMELVFRKLNDL